MGHVIARNGGHALNLELVQTIQRAVGLARRAALEVAAASEEGVRHEGFVPAPAI
jgi:hypothetical protein